jgi:hypothetical protein
LRRIVSSFATCPPSHPRPLSILFFLLSLYPLPPAPSFLPPNSLDTKELEDPSVLRWTGLATLPENNFFLVRPQGLGELFTSWDAPWSPPPPHHTHHTHTQIYICVHICIYAVINVPWGRRITICRSTRFIPYSFHWIPVPKDNHNSGYSVVLNGIQFRRLLYGCSKVCRW